MSYQYGSLGKISFEEALLLEIFKFGNYDIEYLIELFSSLEKADCDIMSEVFEYLREDTQLTDLGDRIFDVIFSIILRIITEDYNIKIKCDEYTIINNKSESKVYFNNHRAIIQKIENSNLEECEKKKVKKLIEIIS